MRRAENEHQRFCDFLFLTIGSFGVIIKADFQARHSSGDNVRCNIANVSPSNASDVRTYDKGMQSPKKSGFSAHNAAEMSGNVGIQAPTTALAARNRRRAMMAVTRPVSSVAAARPAGAGRSEDHRLPKSVSSF